MCNLFVAKAESLYHLTVYVNFFNNFSHILAVMSAVSVREDFIEIRTKLLLL